MTSWSRRFEHALEPASAPFGDVNVIDAIFKNGDRVTLGMAQQAEWGSPETAMIALRAKLDTYLAFVLDGQLAEDYPELRPARIVILVRCVTEPPGVVAGALEAFSAQIPVDYPSISIEIRPARGGSHSPRAQRGTSG